jgi:predicted alpha/beta hydrolase family esterase
MNFIILHGTLGSPNDNWFPWLSKKLENTGHKVHRPKLPTPEGQNLPSWVGVIDSCVKTIHVPLDQIIFVAHSMSPYAVCHYLTTISSPVHSCYFVAPFAKRLPDTPEPYPALNNPFVDTPIDWNLVRDHALWCRVSHLE